jgi:chlorinating enzyme
MDILDAQRLTETQKAFFRENGYVGPFSLNDISSRHLVKNLKKQDLLTQKKDAHLFSSSIYSLATQPQVLNFVCDLLGQDLLLWLGQIFRRKSGDQGLPWHVDQINAEVEGVHVSIAITDMTLRNGCLNVIPKTHQYQVTNEEMRERMENGEIDRWDAGSMAALADRLHPENAPHQVVSMEMNSGQYFFTRGGLWHNVVPNQTNEMRLVVIARFMKTNVERKDLCSILVRGSDIYKVNKLHPSPAKWFQDNWLLNYYLNKLSQTSRIILSSLSHSKIN